MLPETARCILSLAITSFARNLQRGQRSAKDYPTSLTSLYVGNEPRSYSRRCALRVYRRSDRETFKFWNLQTGVCEATLELDASSGHEQYGEVQDIDLDAQLLLIERSGYAEVRYMPSTSAADSDLPVIWAFAPPEQDGWCALGVSLLSPHFVSVIASSDTEDTEDFLLHIRIYQLEPTSSRLLAVMSLPLLSRGPVNHIACGASLVPEAEGLVVISVLGDLVSHLASS